MLNKDSAAQRRQFKLRRLILILVISSLLALYSSSALAQHQNFNNYSEVEGLPQKQFSTFCQDSHGCMWSDTFLRATRFNGYEYKTFNTDNGLKSNASSYIVGITSGRRTKQT